MSTDYIPDTGDIVWLNFNPQIGHEQAGNRPCIVLSPKEYNAKTSLMICCPLTTQIKGYSFEVVISDKNKSAVLADQVKSLDWRKRGAQYKGKVPQDKLQKVRTMISLLIGLK